MRRQKAIMGLDGFTLIELLIASVVTGILLLAVSQAVEGAVRMARRSFSASVAHGGTAVMAESLQEDFNRARYESSYGPRGTATNLWFGMEGDYDGDGEEDAVCYRYFTVAEDTAGQGYLGRVVYPNGKSPYPTATSPTCAVTPVNSPDFQYSRLVPPDTRVQDFAFTYCRPSATKDSHQMVCGNATSSGNMQNRCGGYDPITLWAIGLTYSTARKTLPSTAWGQMEAGSPKSWRTYAFQMRNLFRQGQADTGSFESCVGSVAGLNKNAKNDCPDAFDVLDRLCTCNCPRNGLDDDGSGLADEECKLNVDSDSDGFVGTAANGCE